MDEQIEQIARAMCAARGGDPDECISGCSWEAGEMGRSEAGSVCHKRAWELRVDDAREAHSVMAGTIAEHRASAEMLFKRLEYLRDMSGTGNRLERGNHAAFNTALEIARATLAALAPPRHD